MKKEVPVLLLPRSSGSFQRHVKDVDRSVRQHLGKLFRVVFVEWSPATRNPTLIIFQSQGRAGDEFPSAVKQIIPGSDGPDVVLAVIQDDESVTSGSDIVPPHIKLRGVVNLHVIPGQSRLHTPFLDSLCERNKYAMEEIGNLLVLPQIPKWQIPLSTGNRIAVALVIALCFVWRGYRSINSGLRCFLGRGCHTINMFPLQTLLNYPSHYFGSLAYTRIYSLWQSIEPLYSPWVWTYLLHGAYTIM